MSLNAESGIVTGQSRYSVEETLQSLLDLLSARGVTLIALIDHSREAQKAGLTMRPTRLVIFGNPRAGTPLMVATPSIALDLQLKILIAEDETGVTRISYNSPACLRKRHGLAPELMPALAAVETLAEIVAN
jgi:uncharacterized protein (DUF302 family)